MRRLHQVTGGELEPLGHPAGLLQLTVAVAGVRAPAEPGHRAIGLRQAQQEALRAGGAPDQHEQQPGGEGIESAGVTDLRAPLEPAANTVHDVVGGDARRLGVEQDPG